MLVVVVPVAAVAAAVVAAAEPGEMAAAEAIAAEANAAVVATSASSPLATLYDWACQWEMRLPREIVLHRRNRGGEGIERRREAQQQQ